MLVVNKLNYAYVGIIWMRVKEIVNCTLKNSISSLQSKFVSFREFPRQQLTMFLICDLVKPNDVLFKKCFVTKVKLFKIQLLSLLYALDNSKYFKSRFPIF